MRSNYVFADCRGRAKIFPTAAGRQRLNTALGPMSEIAGTDEPSERRATAHGWFILLAILAFLPLVVLLGWSTSGGSQ
jgi:hypothetical protein